MVTTLADSIIKRVQEHGRGQRVYTPKDFLDLGSNLMSVDDALSRLCRDGFLRQITHELYDFPRLIPSLNREAAPNIDDIIAAWKRYKNVRICPDGIISANSLGLTTAVPAKAVYLTDTINENLKIGNRTIYFRQAEGWLTKWFDHPGAFVIQALDWLGEVAASTPEVINILRIRLTDDVKKDLLQGIKSVDVPLWISTIITQAFVKDESTIL